MNSGDSNIADAGEAGLRPLTACVAGSGVMTLGLLQFVGNVWNDFPDPARQEMLLATRIGFIALLFALISLVLAWVVRRIAAPWWIGVANLYGLLVFAGSALVITRSLGRALTSVMPQGDMPLPDDVQGLLGIGGAALVLLALSLPVLFAVHYWGKRAA